MKQYLDLLRKVYTEGATKSDRTGTGTKSIFGAQMRFNLNDGFPLVTTKQVHFPSVVAELLWFLSGSTNVKDLQAMGCKIWDEWRAPYGMNRDLVLVTPRNPEQSAIYSGDYSHTGLGFRCSSDDAKLAGLWVRMMRRCYDVTHHRFALYGGCGASVHTDWHDPAVFVREVKLLPQWFYKRNNWDSFELDKDYYGSKQYGKDTSVWLRTDENNKYTKAATPITVKNLSGEEFIYLTLNDAASAIGMPPSTLCRFVRFGVPTTLKSANKKYLGYEFYDTPLEGKLLRLSLHVEGEMGPIYSRQWRNVTGLDGVTIDQISNLIQSIKTNPDSRRHIVSAWNVADIPQMALAPCHTIFQFDVTDGKLSCQLYQRSADMFLGVPFNIASYALLTHMVAEQCGLDVGEFIWTGGDCHIYSNHYEQVELQLSRTPHELPRLELPKADSIFSYELGQVTHGLSDYYPDAAIRAKVSV